MNAHGSASYAHLARVQYVGHPRFPHHRVAKLLLPKKACFGDKVESCKLMYGVIVPAVKPCP